MKSIPFKAEQVRALLDGRMTATRQAVKPPALYNIVEDEKGQCVGSWYEDENGGYCYPTVDDCPYQPGDILYVRETFFEYKGHYYYKADKKHETLDALIGGSFFKWKPSRHMPKEAARLFLRVTGVRAERLQDMTGHDVLAEGVDNGSSNPTMGARWENMQRMAFEGLWNSTIKKADLPRYGWAANPWVWVIEFERISKEEAHGTTK